MEGQSKVERWDAGLELGHAGGDDPLFLCVSRPNSGLSSL